MIVYHNLIEDNLDQEKKEQTEIETLKKTKFALPGKYFQTHFPKKYKNINCRNELRNMVFEIIYNYLNFASLLTLGWIWQNALPILEERHEFEKAQAEDERNRLARFEICGPALEILAFLHPCLTGSSWRTL